MAIAIFPGVFNPVHNFHIDIALNVLNKFSEVDKVVFVPTSDKYNKKDIISSHHRYNMLCLATENNPKIEISNVEIREARQLYTYETLRILENEYKTNDIYLIIGSDNLKGFNTWYKYEKILAEYKVIIIARDTDNTEKIIESNKDLYKYKTSFKIITNINSNMNSTEIREKIHNCEDLQKYLSEKVIEYIKENNLY